MINRVCVSQRATGTVDSDGKVTITKLLSYDLVDLVAEPGFSSATMASGEYFRELERQELLRTRKEKINKLNNLNN